MQKANEYDEHRWGLDTCHPIIKVAYDTREATLSFRFLYRGSIWQINEIDLSF